MGGEDVAANIRQEDVQYLVDHEIPDLFNDLISDLGKKAPEMPLDFMDDWLKKRKSLPQYQENVRKTPTQPIQGQKTGTSGLRKKVSVFKEGSYLPNWVQSLFNALRQKFPEDFLNCTLLLGGDGRYYNKDALQLIIGMAFANGVRKVIVGQDGMLATPAVSAIIRSDSEIFGGIIMTASHNPGGPNEDWGVKYNCRNGEPAPESLTDVIYEHTKSITHYYMKQMNEVNVSEIGVTNIGDNVVEVISSAGVYVDALEKIYDFPAIKKLAEREDFSFVLDTMNGVGAVGAKEFIKRLDIGEKGEKALVGEPKEDFGGLHPDPNLIYAKRLVDQMYADDAPVFGAAFDGDADRNMILGSKFFVTPSDSVAIIAQYANEAIPYFKKNNVKGLARSMPTAMSIDRVAKHLKVQCYEVPTGWKYFCNLMDAEKVSICGEESFGTGSDHVREKDGLWAMLAWLQILAYKNESTEVGEFVGVQQIVEDHWKLFGRSLYCRYDFEAIMPENGQDENPADKMMKELTNKVDGLKGKTYGDYEVEGADVFDYTDPTDQSQAKNQGIRIYLKGGSRVVFRLSGTGSQGATVRIYFEKYLQSAGVDCEIDSKDGVKDLAEVAYEVSQIKEITGRTEPSVIT